MCCTSILDFFCDSQSVISISVWRYSWYYCYLYRCYDLHLKNMSVLACTFLVAPSYSPRIMVCGLMSNNSDTQISCNPLSSGKGLGLPTRLFLIGDSGCHRTVESDQLWPITAYCSWFGDVHKNLEGQGLKVKVKKIKKKKKKQRALGLVHKHP